MDQSVNPFTVGDKIIIALLHHENANKLMAKWKGPFTVTKIPNRFQIEYLDGKVTRLTHISYAKKYNERCHHTEQVGMPRPQRVSKRKPWVRMVHLRLIAGTGCRKARMVVSTMKAIQDNWGVKSGLIRIQVLGEVKDLPPGLQAIVEAAGPESCIEGSVLVDLCEQKSGQRGSGCDAPSEGDELPMTMASSPEPSALPAAQVRQYSCHHYAKNDVSDIRREFVGTNKQKKHVSPFLSQQAPLDSRVHLLQLVERIGKRERSKGKHLSDYKFKEPHLGDRKDMTSLLLPGQKADDRNTQSSLMLKGSNNSEIGLGDHKYQHISDKSALKDSRANKKEQKAKVKLSGSTNYDVINDATPDGDVTNPDVNKLVAKTREVQKHFAQSRIRPIGGSLKVCNMTFTKITLLLVIVISVFDCLFNIKLSERKSTVGNSSSLRLSEHLIDSFREISFRSAFSSLVNILSINKELCPCMMTEMGWNNNKWLKRHREVLHNMRI